MTRCNCESTSQATRFSRTVTTGSVSKRCSCAPRPATPTVRRRRRLIEVCSSRHPILAGERFTYHYARTRKMDWLYAATGPTPARTAPSGTAAPPARSEAARLHHAATPRSCRARPVSPKHGGQQYEGARKIWWSAGTYPATRPSRKARLADLREHRCYPPRPSVAGGGCFWCGKRRSVVCADCFGCDPSLEVTCPSRPRPCIPVGAC
jgi:hypothetical protein